jgi:hypothetical protein
LRGTLEAAKEEAGDGEQNQRHGDLSNDEEIAQTDAAAGRFKAGVSFEGICDFGT